VIKENQIGIAKRDKYWNERNDQEKLEALRTQVQQLTYQLGQMGAIVEGLMQHSHADGKIVAPIERRERHEPYMPISLKENHETR
jgi:hypothetical protein